MKGLFSGKRVVRTAAEKHRLHERYQVDAVDMESLSVLKVATLHSKPAVVIRAIIDGSRDVIPDFIDAEVGFTAVINGCLRNPASFISVLHLANGLHKATRALAPVAMKMIETRVNPE